MFRENVVSEFNFSRFKIYGRTLDNRRLNTSKNLNLVKSCSGLTQLMKLDLLRIKLLTTSVCPISHARYIGVCSSMSRASTQAPN